MSIKKNLALIAFLVFTSAVYAQQLIKTTMHWTRSNTTYDFLGNGEFKVDANNIVDGKIDWSIKQADPTGLNYYRDKMNATAIEFVKGTYDPLNRKLFIQGYAKSDPVAIISLDSYQITLINGYQVSGITKGGSNGAWVGVLNGTYSTFPITYN